MSKNIKNYTIFQYIVLVGAVIVAITDWGSPASLIIIGLVIITGILVPLIKWCSKKYQLAHPFKSTYKKENTIKDFYTEAEIDSQGLPKEKWPCTNTKSLLRQNSKSSIYLDLVPRISQELSMVDVRFVPDNAKQPEIIFFQDLTPPARLHNKPVHKRTATKGIALNYDPFMPIIKGGKALDYLVNVQTFGKWQGELSLQFSFVHVGVKYIRIKVEVI